MFSQYAGWPVQHDKFFAMGSGPMRVRRGREEILEHLDASDPQPLAVGTLECDQLPTCEIASAIAAECDVSESQLWLAVAPTRSVAGCIQVVARSIETALHKMHELGFPLQSVVQGYGTAPLCPPVPDFVAGIGRTNDAILYGGHVSLWVSCDDDQVETVVDQLPSCASSDYGQPFVEIFAKYDHDFYKVDPNLFSPAEIMICNQKTGKVWRRGRMREEIIEKSFAVS